MSFWGLRSSMPHRSAACRPCSTTINSGRYQFAFGPVGDFASAKEANDFVDYVQEIPSCSLCRREQPLRTLPRLMSACGISDRREWLAGLA